MSHYGQNKASKSTTLLMKQSSKAVTMKDILKAKKFYMDDTTMLDDIKHNTSMI